MVQSVRMGRFLDKLGMTHSGWARRRLDLKIKLGCALFLKAFAAGDAGAEVGGAVVGADLAQRAVTPVERLRAGFVPRLFPDSISLSCFTAAVSLSGQWSFPNRDNPAPSIRHTWHVK